MVLLIYDNGNLVKNLSDAQFPQRGVDATSQTSAAQNSLPYNELPQQQQPQQPQVTVLNSAAQTQQRGSTSRSSQLYEETGRKSDSLQDRRRLNAVHIMSSPVISVKTFDTVKRAWDLTEQEDINHLVVANAQGEPVGVLTTGDILKHGTTSSSFVDTLIQRKSLIAVSPETLVRDIALIFMDHKVSCVPVIDENHVVAGIITRSDLLRLLVSGPNLEQRA
ncbi:CBS domain-containing protein [Neptunomonas sp. XY-337]|uniref:CBS domain-containing protein n=1 Tax=Neptunomonas sp. XY-337 TaxID=2561897 RepID=UPI0010A9F756|nr:CBS domain-containing protein [Neptunomonas sp. XY-337]